MFRRSRQSLPDTRQDEEANLDQEWRCSLGCPMGFPNQSRGRTLALHAEPSAGTSKQGHSNDVAPCILNYLQPLFSLTIIPATYEGRVPSNKSVDGIVVMMTPFG